MLYLLLIKIGTAYIGDDELSGYRLCGIRKRVVWSKNALGTVCRGRIGMDL